MNYLEYLFTYGVINFLSYMTSYFNAQVTPILQKIVDLAKSKTYLTVILYLFRKQ